MYKIMLADDEGIVIDALKFIINKHFGNLCTIQSAKTGRSVIELAESFRPDIAFMDIQMPGINGIDAMKEIRRANQKTKFIVLTAYDKFDYAKEAINLGVIEYLNKPVEQNRIVEVLKKAFSMIDTEREKRSQELMIREKMENVTPIIENGLVQNLITREYFDEDITNYKNLLGITQQYGYMCVLVCGEEQEGNHMTNAVGAGIRAESFLKEIKSMTSDYIEGVIGSVMANKIPILVPYDKDRMDYNERIAIIEKSRELARKLKAKFDISFRVGIGSVLPFLRLYESYNEAISALINTDAKVSHADDMPNDGCLYEEDYPIETEKLLFEISKKGDVNGVIAEANHFFDWMENNHADDLTDIKLKALEFVLWAEHQAYESGGKVYHFRSRQDYLPTIIGLNDLSKIRTWFVEKMANATRNITVKTEEKSLSVVEKAKQYIEENYAKDLSLDEMSREADVSPYYFSKLFKEETGENFIEYLTNVRIENAKKLLTQSGYSMKEICVAVGYQDPNYFSRIFKKNVGETPTEYKERMLG